MSCSCCSFLVGFFFSFSLSSLCEQRVVLIPNNEHYYFIFLFVHYYMILFMLALSFSHFLVWSISCKLMKLSFFSKYMCIIYKKNQWFLDKKLLSCFCYVRKVEDPIINNLWWGVIAALMGNMWCVCGPFLLFFFNKILQQINLEALMYFSLLIKFLCTLSFHIY